MAQTDKKKVSRIKTKKKTWFKILAPKVFGQKDIGETYLNKAEDALNRQLKVNLKELSGNVRDQNVYLSFKMDKVDGATIRTSVIGYQLTPAIIRRLVRKNTDRVDDYFIVQTKSGREVVIKSLLITIRKAQASVKTQLRKLTQEVIKEEMEKGELDLFVTNLVNGNMRNLLKKKLNKTYPLREATIRVLFYRGEEKASVVEEEKEPAKTTPNHPPQAEAGEKKEEGAEKKEEPSQEEAPTIIEDQKETIKEENKEKEEA